MLANKVILVTGGSQGIGAGICQYAAEQGAQVAIHYNSSHAKAVQVKEKCLDLEQGAQIFQANLENRQEALQLVKDVWNHYGRIDIFVHNAAVCPFKPFVDITPEEWDQTLNVNLNSAFFMSQYVVRQMISSKIAGRIIFISSVLSEIAAPTQAHYSTTKGALKMLTKGMARELGIHGITVNAVGPAAVETEMSKSDWEQPGAKDKLQWLVPLGRLGQPRDVATAVAYLASEDAAFITGQSLYIDGGLLTSKK